jgi:cell division septum initiation protein DivIVA
MGTTTSPTTDSAGTPDFTIVLRGYERTQVDLFIERLQARIEELTNAATKAKTGTTDARDRINELERKVAEQSKQLDEAAQPTLSGLGTRVEQLLRLAEEQANEHRDESKREAEKLIAAAHLESKEVVEKARAVATAVKTAAEREAKATRDSAEREANEGRAAAKREAEALRAEAERETSQLRTVTDHEVAELRATAEREIATVRATAEREIIELRNVASREAEEKRAAASKLLTKAKEKREAELQALELELAERRERSEREESERHDAAVAATQKLVAEAEQRAKAADVRAKETEQAVDQRRRDSEAESNEILEKAKSFADRTVADAKSEADQLVFDAKTHAEVTKQTAEREVAELTRQRDAVTNQLTQLREMLSGLAGLGTLPTEQQATVEEAAEKIEDVQEAVDEATGDNGASEGSGLRVGNTG